MNGFISIKESDNVLKQKVAYALEDYIKNCDIFHNDGYTDINSELITTYLKQKFNQYTWFKNSSQATFDIYTPDGNLTIELKSKKIRKNKKGNFSLSRNIMTNASVLPDQVYGCDVNKRCDNSVFDVLILFVEKYNNKVIRYCIVDGSYWDIDKDLFADCKLLYKQLRESKEEILKLISDKYNNKFVNLLLDGKNNDISFDLRKLITVKNPIGISNV